jgi:hypothetical protein
MDNDTAAGGYNSANINRRPKPALITNIIEPGRLARLQKAYLSNRRLFILLAIAVVCVLIFLGTVIYLLFLTVAPVAPTDDATNWQDTVEQVRKEVEPVDVYAPSDDYFTALKKINAAIKIAEESGNRDYVYEMQLIKADFLLNNAHPSQAVEESLVPQYEAVWEEQRKYEVLRRMVQAFDSTQDYINRKTYTEIILQLPDDVLGDSKGYYEGLLKENP